MILDAHHHLWQPSRGDYGWLDSRANPTLAVIERDFLVDDYHRLAAAIRNESETLHAPASLM